jgi:F0F1-type ATP synthase assembly protein I
MDNLPDGRSPYALAMEWVTRITTISLEMVLPGVMGYWIDQRLGTKALFLLIGLSFGLVGGMWQLIKLTKKDSDR